MGKKVVAVFTGNRAEYGLQLPLLEALKNSNDFEYQLIVSGAHLDDKFGRTIEEIEKDGFKISGEVKIPLVAGSNSSTALAIGEGVVAVTEHLSKLKPDLFVVYADRFEGFAATIASTQMNIPTAHIEGGDLTEGGALDDSVRHAMTKLSHLHFTTNEQASNRVLGMGEESWRVKTVGLPAIDLIKKGNYATPKEIKEKLKLDLSQPIILFTQHSVSTEFEKAKDQVIPSLNALRQLASEGHQVILTYPNNDAGGEMIIEELKRLDDEGNPNIQLHSSLGRYLYHGVLALAKNESINIVCAGNSSSGLKETPAFGCPSVNIGSRQEGRLRAENVINSEYGKDNLYQAIKQALTSDFKTISHNAENPYGDGLSGELILDFLRELDWDQKKLIRKKMTLQGQVLPGGGFL